MSAPVPPPPPPVSTPRRGGRLGAVASAGSAAALLGLWSVTAAGRELAAPPFALVVLVVFLPYLYLGLAATVFAAWTAAPDRRTPPVVLALLLCSGLWLWIPGRGRAPTDREGEGRGVRVMSWNVQRLWGRDGAEACVAGVLGREAPDVVALLEVSARDVERLSEAAGLDCRHRTYTSDARADRGGFATCARRGGAWRPGRWDSARFVDDEDWYYLLAEYVSGPHRFNLLAAHLYPYRGVPRQVARAASDPSALPAIGDRSEVVSRGQSDQAAALLERVSGLRDPTVVAGDFNSTPDAALHVALRRRLTDAWDAAGTGFGGTVHLFGLPLRVDYVYVSSGIGVGEARVVTADCADHAPVAVDLRVP
jgi:endonuclease/exonuclease/phosphatase (EEP) superfamily protein YafD